MEKNGKKIAIENESTGIIKLISLLSALVYYVQDERAIVLIDELDIHIFEYLLATLLEKLSKYAKGQLIFTAHNLLPLEKLNRNSIIISTIENEQTTYVYFKGTSGTTNLRQ
ncbi:MAG: AAA family ATPase, partial [Cetobacterium sp.]